MPKGVAFLIPVVGAGGNKVKGVIPEDPGGDDGVGN